MIPQQTVQQILDTARIEEVVGDFVQLKRRGASFTACCPFHNEKTPSFYVTPSKGIFKCFGCGKAGTSVGFVMEHEHFSYVEALRYLADKYHIEVEEHEESAEDIALRQRRESLLLVLQFAQDFFVSQLSTKEGQAYGYAYYRSRGLEDETIRRFGLGWAPSSRTALRDAALKAGYKVEYLLDAGLCVKKEEDGSILDKFHSRVTFPILSLAGKVTGFSCRTLRTDENIPKYINSPQTEIYDKSRSVYGIYLAKGDITKAGKCYLVEGNVDVVSMHQIGITNLVASCGTSLTLEQVRIIKKFTDNITVMYDGDKAGIHAAQKAADIILGEGMNVRIVLFPDGEDPDSFSRKHSLPEIEDYIATHENDFVLFMCELLLRQAEGDPIKKANLINTITDTVSVIPDPIKRSTYVEEVAKQFNIETSILFDRIDRIRRDNEKKEAKREARALPSKHPVQVSQAPAFSLTDPSEKDLLFFLLAHGTEIMEFPSDSEFYSGSEDEKYTVADFISSSIESDGEHLINPLYQMVYDSYMKEYSLGTGQDGIIKAIFDSPDREIAAVVAELSSEKYELTVSDFKSSLMTTSSWLVHFVPRTLMFYMTKKIEYQIDLLRRRLSMEESNTDEILTEMVRLQNNLRAVKKKMNEQ